MVSKRRLISHINYARYCLLKVISEVYLPIFMQMLPSGIAMEDCIGYFFTWMIIISDYFFTAEESEKIGIMSGIIFIRVRVLYV